MISHFFIFALVPTLCVGMDGCDALRRGPRQRRDAESPDMRSHAERGNEREASTGRS